MTMNEDKIEKMTLKILKEILNRYPVESNHSNYSNPLYQKAWDIVQKAVKKAKDLQVDVVITLLDSSARVIMTYRMEHALLVSDEMAYKKAYTAVGMKMESKDLKPLTQPGQWLYQLEMMLDNKIVSLSGGVPIFEGEHLLGSIGVSGGNSIQDQEIALYAIGR